jgi:YidC/Oxa1 family membrane protein insertase
MSDGDSPRSQKFRIEGDGPIGRKRNGLVAIILSLIVLIGWPYFFNFPQMEELRAAEQVPPELADRYSQQASAARESIIAASPRVNINTPSINGSISLKGARIDDVRLVKYHETPDPKSPPIVLLSPTGTDDPFYAEFGWLAADGATLKIPDQNTLWQLEGSGSLTPGSPVTLRYDNGAGLRFRRIISIDDRYLFTIKDEVSNKGSAPVTLLPFALISRHGTPKVAGFYIVHEGLVGYLGDQGLQQYSYKKIDDAKAVSFKVTNAWLGITDRYLASALLPDTNARILARFSSNLVGATRLYQTDYLQDPQTIAVGGTGSAGARLFAGAKEANAVGINFPGARMGGYNRELGLNHFDLLIDWGWFYFITKPMFLALDWLYYLVGNLGVAILILTAIFKLVFAPFANQSYRAMIKMQHLQPQIAAIRERGDDPEQSDKEVLELYKRDNVTAPSGCLPFILQLLIFFAFFKIFFVTIEMRAPFFGWISDLAVPDPTNLFNLFGLIPFDPLTVPIIGQYLHIGAWPVILGLTVWQLQRNISPIKLGSFQRIVYATLPIIAVYSANSMAAGVAIYLAFYSVLSIFHQLLLFKRAGSATGNISEYSAAILPYGKIQPVIFLMMLAPVLQDVFIFLVFWRRSKRPKTKS